MTKIKYKGGYKYQLTEGYAVELPLPDAEQGDWIVIKDKVLSITKGYAWDGASGPTIDSPASMRGSLVHDALYQLMREKRLPFAMRKHADLIFYRMCREDGMWWWRAKLWYHALRLFGAKNARP